MRRSRQARLSMPQKKMPPPWNFPTCLKKKPHLKSRFAARMRTMRKPASPRELQLQKPELSYVASFRQISHASFNTVAKSCGHPRVVAAASSLRRRRFAMGLCGAGSAVGNGVHCRMYRVSILVGPLGNFCNLGFLFRILQLARKISDSLVIWSTSGPNREGVTSLTLTMK